jgi:adenosylcobinamide kinase/adenosylcobinamide-phosphate guanylyltransferase
VLGTAPHDDPSFKKRIATLQELRPAAWENRDVGSDLAFALADALSRQPPCPQILIDSMSQWLAVLILSLQSTGEDDLEAKVMERLSEIFNLLKSHGPTRIVMVSAEVGGGPSSPRPIERMYRQLVGLTNQRMASLSASVISVQAGIPQFLKR